MGKGYYVSRDKMTVEVIFQNLSYWSVLFRPEIPKICPEHLRTLTGVGKAVGTSLIVLGITVCLLVFLVSVIFYRRKRVNEGFSDLSGFQRHLNEDSGYAVDY